MDPSLEATATELTDFTHQDTKGSGQVIPSSQW